MKTKRKSKIKYAFLEGESARLLATGAQLESWGIPPEHHIELSGKVVVVGLDTCKGDDTSISPGGWFVPATYLRKLKGRVSRG